MCGGLHDGPIRVWNRATLEVERTLTVHGAGVGHSVWAMVSVERRLLRGSFDDRIRVWDVATGRCDSERVLEGHTVACVRQRLVSPSQD